MGAPSDNDPDRKAQDEEAPLDDGWSTGSPAHNDRTTHGLYVDPSSVAQLVGGRKVADHDRTTIGTGEDAVVLARGSSPPATPSTEHDRTTIEPDAPTAKAVTEDSTIAKLDQTMADLEASDVRNDQTKAGLGIAQQLAAAAPSSAPAPASRLPAFAVLRAGGGTIPLEKQQELRQPEQSPLAFVMRDVDPNSSAAPQRPHTSGDSSKFTALLGDQPPPPRVDTEHPGATATAMQPVLRRARLRRRWIALGALAATAIAGTAVAMQLNKEAPRTSANETAKVTETASPAAAPPTAPTGPVNDGITPPPEPPPEPPPPPEQVAIATTTPEPTPETKPADPAPVKKRVATKDVTEKKSTTKKKSTTAKKSTKKVATAKKSTTKKKPTTKKSTTAKKTTTKSTRRRTTRD